ncbi:sensor histidine kinase [Photobacterium sanguinicancri]|uniref:histidine kinase n=1 Tax=Photobacterium sanguinicancri TaxID=875932 RepID=A0ABX4G0T6_9GAMM|nr:HAMP domain-containing sensor histidine kinase [Photobacterium sanguinicancri]KXI22571.1 ATPase [Photobacterium sanguinicancri]OZS44210.1 sensor histidine kinase [Photobacterium sanguinicancri]
MFFDNRELLSRSSTFKLLLYFLACIGVIYTVFVHQVYLSSDAFHRKQLDRELSQETEVFAALATQGKIDATRTLIAEKQSISSPFTYHIQPVSTQMASLSYPAALTGNQPYFELSELKSGSSLLLDDHTVLRIEINQDLLQQYRDDLAPMMISGVALPVIVMIAGAVWFAVNIIQKLQRVNFAMNRVLCGEKSVKLAVSRNDDEFDLLSIHLNFMIEQIEKKESSLKALTVGIAHDLRTPMSRMKLRIESLLDDANNPQIKEELEACHDDLELLLGMFNGMLEIANLNSGKQLVSKQPVDLAAVAQDAVDFLRPLAEEKLQQLTIRQDTPYQLDGEPNLLFRATINLIENAIKYTPEKGIITVVIDPFGVVVIDNGEGISDLDKSRVCEPMYRGDKSRTQAGYGLGLSLVDAVMKRHGGEVIFRDNTPGLRARLYFS